MMQHARRASCPSANYHQDSAPSPSQPPSGQHLHSQQGLGQSGIPQHQSFQSLQHHPQQQQQHQHTQPMHQQPPPPPPQHQQQQKQPQQQPALMHEHLQYPTHQHHPTLASSRPAKGNSGGAFADRPPPSSLASGTKLVRSHSHTLSHPHLQLPPHHNYASPPPPHPSQHQRSQKQQQQQQPFQGKPMHPSMSLPIHPMSSPPTSMHDDYHQQHQRQQHIEATMESDDSASDNEACVGGIQWTRQEDNLLREAAAKFSGKAWKRIAEYCFPDGSRDKDQCLQRWRMISKPRSIKGPWTPEEDRQLRNLVKELGAEKWVLIASRLGSRTGKQCRERWHNHLDPSIDKSPFTAKEDELIFKLFEQFGSKWADMSKLMPGRPDNAIKNHFNTSMQRKRRRLSLQDPSELQMKLQDNNSAGSTTANISPLASPTSTTSPTALSRNHRFDPYERRHSMPSLEMAAKAHAGFQAAHSHSHSHGGPENQHDGAQTPRSVLTPPITPDTKGKIQFSPSMSRSVSMGSNVRSVSGNYPPHSKPFLQGPSPGPTRPNLPGNPSIHKSNGPYYASTSAAMVTSVSSPNNSLAPNMQSKLTRSSSAMAVPGSSSGGNGSSTEGTPHSGHPMEHGYGYYHQEQQLNHSLPRPNMTRHESLGHRPSRQGHHEHFRSLDMDPFSALAELADLAEQHREMPVRDRLNTVVVQSKEEPAEYGGGHESEWGPRRASLSALSDRNNDIEDAVMSTKIAKPNALTRRFSTSLSHLKEEDHSEDHQYGYAQNDSQQRLHHSYHTDQQPGNGIQAGRRHSCSPSTGISPPAYFRSEHSSGDDYSGSEQGGSDRDQDDMEMDHDVKKPPSPSPSASYLAIRRGSVRELMAIDNLCLSSEEMGRR